MTASKDPFDPTWLCPTPSDRARVLDMERRLRPVRNVAFGALALALVAGGHWVGWWTLAPLGVAIVGFAVAGRGLEERPRPEQGIALAWCLSLMVIALSVGLSGGPQSPGLPWLVIPIVTLPARFRLRGVIAGVCLSVIALLIVSFGIDAGAVVRNPTMVIFTFALIISVTSLSVALMRSDVDHRSEAVIDPLTSMLNRNALSTRVDELTQQARITRQPVALVVADIDCFKAINDEHGHDAGDAVLRDVAYRMRAELRAYDLAYRLGGEEFLVLLPGATSDDAAEIAERLRAVVASTSLAGLSVTMSFGVSASTDGLFDYRQVFGAADQALYMAKRAGRNCVRVLVPGTVVSVPALPKLAVAG
ncbi:MAG: diguanylate cyclase [Solirubrobacteraceae bacterium]